MSELLDMEDDLRETRLLLETGLQLFGEFMESDRALDEQVAEQAWCVIRHARDHLAKVQSQWEAAVKTGSQSDPVKAGARAEKCWGCDGPVERIQCNACGAPAFPTPAERAAA